MPKITIDGKPIDCRDKIPVLQAAIEAGWDVPFYCFHPGLTVVASCRLCLMEMKMPNPKTKEMDWAPRLFPSCQTPVKDGLEVRFDSDSVRANQRSCMEYFLINHPLDCPVCDQAGECYLQDYSLEFGDAASRMVEAKNKNPKKDVGSKTLLYQDRCVMCSRCVRFCDEVSGTNELCIVNRGSRAEIDVFPGIPLENALQGNVVDVCPVGSLLDKDFLMKQRVWFLKETPSICPNCSAGCAIEIHQNENTVWRLKPRYNPGVNDWWMCDEGRFGWKYVHDPKRLNRLTVRRGAETESPDWSQLPEIARYRFAETVKTDGAAKVGALLSPWMSCEEAWLLAKFIRDVAPQATLAMGPVPVHGEDEKFPKGNGRPVRFTIRAEKCPNRRGIEKILAAAGGATCGFDEFVKKAAEGAFAAAWITGGDPTDWVTPDLGKALAKIPLIFAQDIFPNPVTEAATVVVPSVSWAERSGSFMNVDGKIQPFEAAIAPREGCQRDGQYLATLAGLTGIYNAAKIREMMSLTMPEFATLHVPPPLPEHAH
ncbi:MAG TPA: 2Fe-2S iron-sulfur cluster-binding protein [Phycisphaerae bacterium]|nr:2Fe-2S iron-sulfur cluster-binding protein [Phycisphaerae bacterium]